jgi:modulator of FtsH protease
MTDVMQLIGDWRDFYAAVANAAAALLGLVFVGLSLQLTMRQAGGPVRSLAIGSAITLIQPLLVAVLMLMPEGAPTVHGLGLIVLAIVLGVQLAVVLRIRIRDRGDSLPWLVYRHAIPLAAAAALFGGGVAMLSGLAGAVFVPALAVFALFVVGVQDAWDLLTGERGSGGLNLVGSERS